MTNEEKYVAKKFRSYKREKQAKMIKTLIEAGYTCNEIAVSFNLRESTVKSYVNSDNESSHNTNE